MIEVKQYTQKQAQEWNDFIEQSRQGTFLFNRSYMDYHADRFQDASLMIYRKEQLYALLPANRLGDTLYSHQGLTYGGLITKKQATTAEICEVFIRINEYLYHSGVQRVIYKPTPWIYHCYPAEEDLYALTYICHAQLTSRDISSTIPLDSLMTFGKDRRRGVRKATRAGVTVRESKDLATFWDILDKNLTNKYATHPVHSLEELTLLHSRFPNSIRLFMAFNDKGIAIGGTIIYEMPQVVHTQYISASTEGKRLGAIDLLFDYILNDVYANRKGFFDFGKSTEEEGKILNTTLIFQKEGFGGRGVCYDCYTWEPRSVIE
ncbi:GNAT family N-acetyltransferase [Prevotella jejuni]